MTVSLSLYTIVTLFAVLAFDTNHYAHAAATCKDSKSKFKIPGVKGKWNCKKLKKKKKRQLCFGADNNVRLNCKNFCGFCPCVDRTKNFKMKVDGKKTKVNCTQGKYCDVDEYGPAFGYKCPKKCDTCDAPSKCILKATFAHPYNDPDDAPYKGYHGDYLEVSRGPTGNVLCDSGTPAPWCIYENSYEGGEYAYLQNIDDYYVNEDEKEKCDDPYDDDSLGCEFLMKETLITRGMGGTTSTFYGFHVYNDQEYYTEYDDWQDNMMAATLKISVLNTGELFDNEGDGWSHPVSNDTLTHTGEFLNVTNPNHQGAFSLKITCDMDCNCETGDFDTFYYDPENPDGPPSTTHVTLAPAMN